MSSIFYDDESLRSGLTGETTGLRARDRVLDFDPNSIITGPCVYVRKKFCYVGHATTAYSVDNAANIVDYIGEKTGCDHCLPFAVRLVEGGEIVKFSEDNGEFACGDVLGSCLDKVQGFNVLVCVSQQVQGMFVTDMMQPQKLRAVKEAAAQVLEILKEQLTNQLRKERERVDRRASPIREAPSASSRAHRGASNKGQAGQRYSAKG
ncbi:hypothetical protein B484DRAFT_401075 [Ochromonadaceae sp. CCMP2298]|nr:hypothetical protein B484DRAFT_401075 [Ochromonadaceae sp. CCMP2298]|eukprot:CAMPEP_0173225086 /NCGR_PEP_ID=MMETSP1142-20121109/4694_1 /TAXON_ID=483371 /ORGANISM="non described non described, Strain CCMP2298" /LENGTH=206 /DNA_ID=CAMNT_0014153415 /DNA_START=11 /DNA_END=631 /DNA_ORIENTATION=-